MIKNVLYSLFLHFLLILLVYANFNLKNIKETKTNEISISLIEVDEVKNSNKDEVKKEKEKIPPKKEEKPKKEPAEVPEVIEKIIPEIKKEEIKPIKEEKEKELPKENPEKPKEAPKKIETPPPAPQKEPKKQEDNNQNDNKDQSVNNLEDINLSVREKFNIQSQLKMCYRRAINESGLEEDKIKITITVEIAKDGFIDSNLEEILNAEKYAQDNQYKTAINHVRRAIDFCSPLRNLPLDKYEIWKKVLLEFGEEK